MRIQFLLPSKSRPQSFLAAVENLHENCMTTDWGITAILEQDDPSMHNVQVLERICSYPRLDANYVTTTGKVAAINEGLKWMPPYDVCILFADDLRITQKGFDCYIEEDMTNQFPNFDGCLHYPDNILQAGERQITMPVLGRELINSLGYIYHPSYVSTWCDNRMLAEVKILNKYLYVNRKFYDHNHPAWGKGTMDDLYKLNESFYHSDSKIYFEQLAVNFGY